MRDEGRLAPAPDLPLDGKLSLAPASILDNVENILIVNKIRAAPLWPHIFLFKF
jgi:hypothetical protein